MGGASEPWEVSVVIAETADTSGCKASDLIRRDTKLWQTIFSTEQCGTHMRVVPEMLQEVTIFPCKSVTRGSHTHGKMVTRVAKILNFPVKLATRGA